MCGGLPGASLVRMEIESLTAVEVGHGPADVVRAAYAAYNRGAFDEIARHVDPDVEWQVPESALTPGTIRGAAELRELIASELEAFSEIRREPLELEERGDRVVGTIGAHMRGRLSGIELELTARYAFTVRAGRIVRAEALL